MRVGLIDVDLESGGKWYEKESLPFMYGTNRICILHA